MDWGKNWFLTDTVLKHDKNMLRTDTMLKHGKSANEQRDVNYSV